MNVSACLVTRGDVDMQPVLDSLPPEWEIILWDNESWINGEQAECYRILSGHRDEIDETWKVSDLSVYGRYAAIEHASHDLIYVQDDDVIVSDPQAIVDQWIRATETDEIDDSTWWPDSLLVANMPPEFRHDGYTDSCLVGFGACFHRDLPAKAFERYGKFADRRIDYIADGRGEAADAMTLVYMEEFRRTCDVVFTTLTPRVLVDVPKTDREMASDPNRMWKQAQHYGERLRMLELARRVRDA